MATTTLTQLIARVRQRADAEADTDWISDAELTQYINDSYNELYALLARHSLLRVETTDTITGSGAATYALPAAFFATVAVFRDDGNDQFVRLRRSTLRDRPFGAGTVTGDAYEYRTANTSIELYPVPSGGTYYHVYVPIPTALSSGSDTIAAVLGWDEYVVVDAAMKCAQKEGSDVGMLMAVKNDLKARIEDEADMQEMSEQYRIADTRAVLYLDPADGVNRGYHD